MPDRDSKYFVEPEDIKKVQDSMEGAKALYGELCELYTKGGQTMILGELLTFVQNNPDVNAKMLYEWIFHRLELKEIGALAESLAAKQKL